MNKRYDQSPRFSATGVTTATILAVIVAMAISVVVDVQPTGQPVKSMAATATGQAKG